MHDIYPFQLPAAAGTQLWIDFFSANHERIVEEYGQYVFTGRDHVKSFSWYEVDVTVKSPIRVEFNTYGMKGPLSGGRGLLEHEHEISHSYDDTTLYPLIAAEQMCVAERVLAERERLEAQRIHDAKVAAVHLELFGEPPCESTVCNT